MKNHYQTLGVERTSSLHEINKAYQKLSYKFHPDKNDGDDFFDKRFRQIQEAYEILGDQYQKGRYDSDFDRFFIAGASQDKVYTHQTSQEIRGETQVDPGELKRKMEQGERLMREEADRKKLREIKRNAVLSFEDKAWIGVASGMTMGIVGIIMFSKFLVEGHNHKSQQVCIITIVGFVIAIIFSLLLTLAKSGNGF